jgi:hypothetical protein
MGALMFDDQNLFFLFIFSFHILDTFARQDNQIFTLKINWKKLSFINFTHVI